MGGSGGQKGCDGSLGPRQPLVTISLSLLFCPSPCRVCLSGGPENLWASGEPSKKPSPPPGSFLLTLARGSHSLTDPLLPLPAPVAPPALYSSPLQPLPAWAIFQKNAIINGILIQASPFLGLGCWGRGMRVWS